MIGSNARAPGGGISLAGDGSLSVPGAGSGSERFGSASLAAGQNSVAVGNNASAGALGTVAIGYNCQCSGAGSICIGRGINSGSSNGVTIGDGASNWSNAVSIGTGANAGGSESVAVGRDTQGGSQTIMIGRNATGGGSHNIGIGYGVSVTGSGGAADSIGIGYQAATGFNQCVCIGTNSAATAANQCVLGGSGTSLTNFFLGKGVTHATPADVTVQPTGGSTSGVVGAGLNLAGGKGGAAATAGGPVAIQTAPAGSGTTLVDRIRVEANGNISLGASPSYGGGVLVAYLPNCTTAPTVAPTGGGVLFVESGALKYIGSSGTVTTIAPA